MDRRPLKHLRVKLTVSSPLMSSSSSQRSEAYADCMYSSSRGLLNVRRNYGMPDQTEIRSARFERLGVQQWLQLSLHFLFSSLVRLSEKLG